MSTASAGTICVWMSVKMIILDFVTETLQPTYIFLNMEADMAHEQAAVMCFALKYLNFYIYFYIFTIYRADKLLLT